MGVLVDQPALEGYWYVVAGSDQLDRSAPVPVRLLGRDLVVWRGVSGVVAAPDRCPHREAPLSLGRIDDGCLVCPYHGWTYGDEGRCVRVPSASEGVPVPPRAHLPAVHAIERYGVVWVCPGEPVAGIPDIVADRDPAFRRINVEVEPWAVSATRMTDNFLDISHFPYVHSGTFGIEANQQVPKIDMVDLDADFVGYEYEVDVDNARGAASSGLAAPVVTRRMTTGYHLPFTVRSTIHYETGSTT